MNDVQRRKMEIELDRKLASHPKFGYYQFFKAAWNTIEKRPLSDNWHIQYLCFLLQEEIQRIVEGRPKEKDLIINVPPRSSKSSIVSVFLNAWAWTQWPHLKFISVSYSQSLSEKHAIATKNVIESQWYQMRWGGAFTFSRKKNTNKEYWTNEMGMRFASSVSGTVTGAGANIIIADDILNPKESKSEAKRKAAIDFYRNTLSNRLNNPETDLIILIQQRTHSEDVVGQEVRDNPQLYRQVVIPAEIVEHPDRPAPEVKPEGLKKFYKEGLFDPKRFPLKVLRVLETRMSDYPSQYLQTPTKPGGNIILTKWFFTYTLEDLYEEAQRAGEPLIWTFELDGAFTKKKENDPTVCIAYCVFRGRAYIRAIFRDWMTLTQLLDAIPEFVLQNGYSLESEIRIEPKANGHDLIDGLISYTGLNAVTSYAPELDKIAMAYSITPELRAERVGVLAGGPFVKAFFDECKDFPYGSHDDQVDCLIMIVKNGLRGSGILASG